MQCDGNKALTVRSAGCRSARPTHSEFTRPQALDCTRGAQDQCLTRSPILGWITRNCTSRRCDNNGVDLSGSTPTVGLTIFHPPSACSCSLISEGVGVGRYYDRQTRHDATASLSSRPSAASANSAASMHCTHICARAIGPAALIQMARPQS